MDPWRTGIVNADASSIRVLGYDVVELSARATFTDVIFLLHRGRLPVEGERRLLDTILIGGADHGAGAPSCAAARLAASGNRQSMSAAVAAGLLTIGEEHGGAGTNCMEMIASGLERARRESLTIEEAARLTAVEARASHARLPGFGHRVHAEIDPRVAPMFALARSYDLAGDGVAFIEALGRSIGEVIRPLPINIDGALAALLHDMGFHPSAGMLVFLISRTAGITAEIAEEYAREKPMRIKFDVAYDGPPPRAID
jgi:citrate synthase